MTSKTSCFNRTICRKTAARFWPLWVGYFVILLLTLPLAVNQECHSASVTLLDIQQTLYQNASDSIPLLTFLISPAAAMAVFSHLYNEKSCGIYAALPVSRGTMFRSVFLAAFLPLLGAQVAVFGLTAAVELSAGMLHLPSLLTWLGVSVLDLISFLGFAVLCAQLTGTTLVVPAVYVVLQFTAYVVENLLNEFAALFLYGYTGYSAFLQIFSPIIGRIENAGCYSVFDLEGTRIGYSFTGWIPAAAYAVFGAACIVLAFLLFRRRRMETAGDFVAERSLKPVFRWCMAFGCALVFSYLMYVFFNDHSYSHSASSVLGIPLFPAMLLFLLIGGFIGWFGAEMLMQKSFRVFGKRIAGYLLFAVLASGMLCVLEFDILGFNRLVPDPAKIEQASLGCNDWIFATEPEQIRQITDLHTAITQTKDANLRADRSQKPYGLRYLYLNYTQKNGRTVTREYRLYDIPENAPIFRAIEALYNTPEETEKRLTDRRHLLITPATCCGVTVSVWDSVGSYETTAFTAEEAWELYSECVLPDAQAGRLERVWLTDDSPNRETRMSCEMLFGIAESVETDPIPYPTGAATTDVTIEEWREKYGKDGVFIRNIYIRPTTESTLTNAWLTAHGIGLTPES